MPPPSTAWRRRAAPPLLAALVLLAAWQNRQLTAARRAGLPDAPAYAAQVPPILNFVTVGLGGFRGVAAEILWMRADRLQEQGRYFELVQLSDWITWLDPHATEAWSYNAWNLAYNISAMMRRPADRLRWVAHGVALLRDRGLTVNPRSAKLYRDLSWFYYHKIGGTDDTAHLAYQLDLAAAMSPLLAPDGSVTNTPEARAGLAAMRLDPDIMRRLERRFGALDWRVAASHAAYWAMLGLEHAGRDERLASRRSVYLPLIQCAENGRFTGDPARGLYRTAPNPTVISPAMQFLDETLRETPAPGVRMAYAFFLREAIRRAQADGRDAQAEAWLRELNRIGEGVFRPMTLEDVLRGAPPRAP
jgi:hypothetical protein